MSHIEWDTYKTEDNQVRLVVYDVNVQHPIVDTVLTKDQAEELANELLEA